MAIRALPLIVVVVACAFARGASAQECAANADCPVGYACTAYLQTCPDCPPDTPCEPCDPTLASSWCEIVPTACAADADCAEGLICVHFSGQSCPGVAPCRADDPNCSTEPPPCEAVDDSFCAPPYVAPCTQDADCGAGFTCETSDVCSCVVYPDPGTGEPPPPEDCTCEATGSSSCVLAYQECTTDNDCPAGLVCTDGITAAAPCFVDETGAETCPGSGVDAQPFCAPAGYVTPLPLEGGGVTAERVDDAGAGEGEGESEGEGDNDTASGSWCASAAGSTPAALLALLTVLSLPGRARGRARLAQASQTRRASP